MILRNSSFLEMANTIKANKSRIMIYGAGMIGQIIVPYIVQQYGLLSFIECYVDIDKMKQHHKIKISTYTYEVKPPTVLHSIENNTVLWITNSKCYSVIEFLDSIPELENIEGYIIPIMKLQEEQISKEMTIEKITDKPVIPKKIHYCWFGHEKMPSFLCKCIKSWEMYCPDYELICWNEDNYDVDKIPYIKAAYEHQKYSFVTDIARLDILYQYGGIYMDTDVTLLKSLDDLLYQQAFVGVEKWGNINTGGGFGAIPHHPAVETLLEYRKNDLFIREDGSLNMDTNGLYETIPFVRKGMKIENSIQNIANVTIYPSCVFHPYDYVSGITQIEMSTISIHHFYGGWMDEQNVRDKKDTQNKYKEIIRRMKDRD